VDCLLYSVFRLLSSLVPRPSYLLSSHTLLNSYSHPSFMQRPIIFSSFLLLLLAFYPPPIFLFPATYLTEPIPPTRNEKIIAQQFLNFAFFILIFYFSPFLLSHTPLNSYSNSPHPLRPIIFIPFTGQKPGYKKIQHTLHEIRFTLHEIRWSLPEFIPGCTYTALLPGNFAPLLFCRGRQNLRKITYEIINELCKTNPISWMHK